MYMLVVYYRAAGYVNVSTPASMFIFGKEFCISFTIRRKHVNREYCILQFFWCITQSIYIFTIIRE